MKHKETLEEFIKIELDGYDEIDFSTYERFIELGAKWQQERSYSLDEIKDAMKNGYGIKYFSEHKFLKNLNNLKNKN
jgi:hypothetical protein